jgi:diadenosine tetraphosphate (Ap4A) HIT family hydrolase
VTHFRCELCGFELWTPIAALRVSTVGLYDDARFPGRCILVYNNHVEDLTELDERSTSRFMADVKDVARAVGHVVPVDRMNYAILGNVEPHLHMHLIPRVAVSDPLFGRPPWERVDPVVSLDAETKREIVQRLRAALQTSSQLAS